MAHTLEFELPDTVLYAEMSDGALFAEIDRLEFWLGVLDFLCVSPAKALVELHNAGEEVHLSRTNSVLFTWGIRRHKAVRANLRIANGELQRRMSDLANEIATA